MTSLLSVCLMSIEPCQDEFSIRVLDRVGAVFVDLRQELRIVEQLRDIAIADAVELEIGRRGVDGDKRDTAARGRGQDEVVAGEVNRGGAVLHIDIDIDLREQAFIDGRGQAGAQRMR